MEPERAYVEARTYSGAGGRGRTGPDEFDGFLR
jgi:hypothetical protein